MPGVAIGTSFNYGYPGTLSRNGDEITRSHPVNSSSANISFGDPVVLNADYSVTKFGASGTDATFAGVAVRKVKQATSYLTQGTTGVYAYPDICDIIERGPVSVNVNVGTPSATAGVYVRITANGSIPLGVVGGFEAAADGSNTVQITNARWGTVADANGVAELVLTGRKGV
jgi:hypothetical protein